MARALDLGFFTSLHVFLITYPFSIVASVELSEH